MRRWFSKMSRDDVIDLMIIILPLFLFPVSFIVLREIFILSMAISVAFMGSLSLVIMLVRGVFYKIMLRGRLSSAMISSVLATAILYIVFLIGGYLSILLGLWSYVDSIYLSIEISAKAYKNLLPIILAFIGFMEEIFWRGYVQGYFIENRLGIRDLTAVLISTLYYTLVHMPTLNLVLIVGAFFVGVITGIIALRYGVLNSIIVHVLWLEFVIVYMPVPSVLGKLGIL
ncbi:MAG: lysostaphin resistance A-like protein [Sulfolobales archaeon]